jgi:glucosamine 6-phosphate synthetase-like amidotransferase/phosphosugar isomerase protein
MESVLEQTRLVALRLAHKLVDAKTLYFIGSGPSYGVANIGGALMAEGPQRVGTPLYVEEFHHSLRVFTIEPGMPLFLIAPHDPAHMRCLQAAQALQASGGYVVALIDEADDALAERANVSIRLPRVPYEMSALLTVLPLQQFSTALTQCREQRGYQRPWEEA